MEVEWDRMIEGKGRESKLISTTFTIAAGKSASYESTYRWREREFPAACSQTLTGGELWASHVPCWSFGTPEHRTSQICSTCRAGTPPPEQSYSPRNSNALSESWNMFKTKIIFNNVSIFFFYALSTYLSTVILTLEAWLWAKVQWLIDMDRSHFNHWWLARNITFVFSSY